MEKLNTFDAAASAYKTVQATIDGLKAEYKVVCNQLSETQSALDSAPLLRVPLDDLKAGILDFVDASGERYAMEHITAAISNFARNNSSGLSGSAELSGKPLRFCDLERAVLGGDRDYNTQLATPSKQMFDDRAFYFLVAPLIKAQLAALMENMSPEQFGYHTIHPDKIGSDRQTRRKEIEEINIKLQELRACRSDLRGKLFQLGVHASELLSLEK